MIIYFTFIPYILQGSIDPKGKTDNKYKIKDTRQINKEAEKYNWYNGKFDFRMFPLTQQRQKK